MTCTQRQVGTHPGDLFLSDETTSNTGLESNLPYGFSFSTPVTALSLTLIDFRGDGGGSNGSDRIVVTAFSDDAFSTSVGQWNIDIENWANPSGYRFSAFGVGAFSSLNVDVLFGDEEDGFEPAFDVGTGIDNLTYETVPEPGTLGLIGAGLLGLVGRARRRRQQS